jgi:hypothetical protein
MNYRQSRAPPHVAIKGGPTRSRVMKQRNGVTAIPNLESPPNTRETL